MSISGKLITPAGSIRSTNGWLQTVNKLLIKPFSTISIYRTQVVFLVEKFANASWDVKTWQYAPALPPLPRSQTQEHFLIIFFTTDPWWGLKGKERKLLELWGWECQKYSPYSHWGQQQESGPKLSKKFCLICINFRSQETEGWSKDVLSLRNST